VTARFFESSADIAAAPDAVWAALTDGAGWSSWDSGVDGVDGRIGAGETITIRSKAAPGRTFPVKVTTFDPPRGLVFSGGLPLGLFKGVRTYRLTPTAGGAGTRFEMREDYSGPLLSMMWRSMPDLGPSFTQFATGLKARAERSAVG
jgi:uncharacterized protein YndB with AHSA1/START domain